MILETAATELAESRHGAPIQIADWYVMFVSRGKVGPFRTRGESFPGTGNRIGVRIDLLDLGQDGRVVSTAAATFGSLA